MRIFAKSLRLRLVVLAAFVMAVSLIATALVLSALFTRHLERRIGQEMDTYIAQLSGAIRFDADGRLTLAREPADPRFNQVFGGLYWQIFDSTTADRLGSRSLWDSELKFPDDALEPGVTHVHNIDGPSGESLLAHEQLIFVAHGGRDHHIRVAAAVDRKELTQLEAGFVRDIAPALAILGLVLLAGFTLQIGSGLRPVDRLRASVAAIRAGRQSRLPSDVPSEIAPLADEVNALLEAKEADMERARDRAADMAHGLKTPLTALAADIASLRAKGEHVVADDIETLAARMHRHVERELTRARHRYDGHLPPASVRDSAESVIKVLRQTPAGRDIEHVVEVPGDLAVPVHPDDLNELIGNLAENATRHARSRVVIAAQARGHETWICIDDDGPGMPEKSRTAARKRGTRLDRSGTGAGLGLAIVQDILAEYGGELRFEKSAIGGLSACIAIPLAKEQS